jgi:hypothetical protein
MKKLIFLIMPFSILFGLIFGLSNCTDNDKTGFEIISLYSGEIDLLYTDPAIGIDPDNPFEATFSIEIDPNSLSTTSITLTKDSDGTRPGMSITGSGKDVMIQPDVPLELNCSYTLRFSGSIKAFDGQSLTPYEKQFTTISR